MFAYCNNNPVMLRDETGEFGWITAGIMAIGGAIGAVVSGATSAITQYATTGEINWGSVAVAAGSGFVSGALSASPLGITWQRIAGGILGGVSYFADCRVNGDDPSLGGLAANVLIGVASANISGEGANKDEVITSAIKRIKSAKPRARELGRVTKALQKAKNALSRVVSKQGKVGAIRYVSATAFGSMWSPLIKKAEKEYYR